MMSELYSVIQLLATLTIGFAVFGHTNYFYNILRTKFFHADDTIHKASEECRRLRVDEVSIATLEPTNVGNGTTAPFIEELKIAYKKTEESIGRFKVDAENLLVEKCYTRSLVSMSLFIFMESVIMLFAPLAVRLYGQAVQLFILSFSALCIVYLIVGWCCGEKSNNRAVTNFESLKHPVIYILAFMVVSCAFSLVFSLWIHVDFGGLWKYLFVSLILFGWINFIVYTFIFGMAISQFKKTVECNKKNIIKECDEVNKIYSDLMTIYNAARRVNGIASTRNGRKP